MTNPMTLKTVKVYACGGLALNVIGAHDANGDKGDAQSGFADIDVSYLDTSKANYTPEMGSRFYQFPDLDGGGKDRKLVGSVVAKWIDHALEMHKPGDVNIIVGSLTGASGSTIGPVLAGELLKAGKTVIVLAALSDTSLQELDNAKSTVSSYEAVARQAGKPIVLKPYTSSNPRDTDTLLISDFVHLRGLFSGVNHAMDSQDLKNWLNYQGKSIKMNNKLYTLDIFGGGRTMTVPALSVAALAPSTSISPPVSVAYLTVGVPPQSWFEGDARLIHTSPVYYAISDAAGDIFAHIDELAAEASRTITANRARPRDIDISGADGSGLVY
jgi:hypothetical protein